MAGNTWENLGKTQEALPGSNAPGGRGYYIPFGAAYDAARKLPNKPLTWNDSVETLRAGGVTAAQGVMGPILGKAYKAGNEATGGNLEKVVMAAPYLARSNYAFLRNIEDNGVGMSLLSGLAILGGALAAGAAAMTAPVTLPVVGAAAVIGAGLTGLATREAAKTGALGAGPQKAAEVAVSKVGQEKYNIGRDVFKAASKITGNDELGDTSKGIAALGSGIINAFYEFPTAIDIASGKVAGAVVRQKLVGPITDSGFTTLRAVPALREWERNVKQLRLEDAIDMAKRTAMGEDTPMKPLFEFLQKSDPATIKARKGFEGEAGNYASSVLAGQDFDTISLVFRAGWGEKEAIDTLKATRTDVMTQLQRYEGQVKMVEDFDGVVTAIYKGNKLTLGPFEYLDDNMQLIKSEIESLRGQRDWLNESLKLESALRDRTVGNWAWVEKTRNDAARMRLQSSLEQKAKPSYETKLGGIMHTIYQESMLSPLVRIVNRTVDDIPRTSINFNDPVQIPTRLRTNLRSAVANAQFLPEKALDIYNRFIASTNEVQKLNIIKEYTNELGKHLGDKYQVHGTAIDTILEAYDRAHNEALMKAKTAYAESSGYALKANNEIVHDPQLISQLANGAALPDPKKWDAAFKRYKEKAGAAASLPVKSGYHAKRIADEFNSLWRTQTLLRGGYPGNVIRDSAVRIYGDAALVPVLMNLSKDTMEVIFNSNNTVARVTQSIQGLNPAKNLNNIRRNIYEREVVINEIKQHLEKSKYDFKNPPKNLTDAQKKALDRYNNINDTINELRRQEGEILSGRKSKPVGKDKMVRYYGYEFPGHFSGRLGEISKDIIRGQQDIRRALGSIKELALENVQRGLGGTKPILPTVDEGLHLKEWVHTLNDLLGNDPVAKMIMTGASRPDVIKFIRSDQNSAYFSRFNLPTTESGVVYDRIKDMVDMYAPTQQLRDLILNNNVTKEELIRLYPDVNQRPVLLTDMVRQNLGIGELYETITGKMKDAVAWLSTAPTSKLMYNPYFQYKYEEKLADMAETANRQGRILTDEDNLHFQQVARSYATSEFKQKLNSFHRDMNYAGWWNYMLAFFPALVEQMRAYGRITIEHPEFLIKAAQVSTIPGRIGEVKEDNFGNKYTEIELPVLGGIKARVNNSWFNVFNPTGSTLISAGPIAAFSANEAAKRVNLPSKIENWLLPYGVRANSLSIVTPSVTSKTIQLFQAQLYRSGEKFNQDANMFLKELVVEYGQENNKKPSGSALDELKKIAEDRAVALAWLRFGSQLTLPTQPRYVTRLTGYQDIYNKMVAADPINGEDNFKAQYPDYWLVTDRLSNNLSGLNADITSKQLAKNNPDVISKIIATVGEKNMSVLGAVFNDDNYAFSSAAQAWFMTSKVPGTSKKFKDYADYLDSTRSAIISKGWEDFTKLKDIVTKELESKGFTVDQGYGKAVLKRYKDAFVNSTQESNPMWYDEYTNSTIGGKDSRQAATVKALTIAANTPKLWEQLKQQPRWHTVVNYLNLRYTVYEELDKLGGRKPTGELKYNIESDAATGLKRKVDAIVEAMRKDDPLFARFYDRYFDGDKFDYIYEEK